MSGMRERKGGKDREKNIEKIHICKDRSLKSLLKVLLPRGANLAGGQPGGSARKILTLKQGFLPEILSPQLAQWTDLAKYFVIEGGGGS